MGCKRSTSRHRRGRPIRRAMHPIPYLVEGIDVGILERSNTVERGSPTGRPIMFAHGFGCDQSMWRYVWPSFAHGRRVILFDHPGAGHVSVADFDFGRYRSLHGYARDVIEICDAL